jgi:alpha-L-arabinofuranosidase
VLLAFTNLHPSREVKLDIAIDNASLRRVSAETLKAAKVDKVNTFDAPTMVTPKPLTAKLTDGRLRATLPARSSSVAGLGK